MSKEARLLIHRLQAKGEQTTNTERNDPIFKEALKTVEALMNTQQNLVTILEAALKNARFERQAFRPWHVEAEDIISKIRAGDLIE